MKSAQPGGNLSRRTLSALAEGRHEDPYSILGVHPAGPKPSAGFVVRAWLPQAASVEVMRGRKATPMEPLQPAGLFQCRFPADRKPFAYKFRLTLADDRQVVLDDPFRFAPRTTDADLELFVAGEHERLYEVMGAQVVRHQGADGVNFCVWAPNARAVSLVGDFNGWDADRHPMRSRGESGSWEIFVPGLGPGEVYKYLVHTRHKDMKLTKSDPYGFFMERRPETASVVWDVKGYEWSDAAWMKGRGAAQAKDAPMSIYEVHLGSWKRTGEDNTWLTYRELAAELIPYVKKMGYTHLELMPISEHPFDGSWGYQAVGYFAPTSRFGTPDDFRFFIDAAHRAGIGVILDWVPAHFPKDGHGLGFFDGTWLYEHADPRKGEHQDWGTLIFNFSRPQVVAFLLNSALFWLETYHIDGLRVDAVASMLYLDYSRDEGEWVPNKYGGRENLEAIELIKRFNHVVHERFPDVVTFAEESTAWPMVSRPVYLGGLGFDLKWNMGWMHDTLEYTSQDPIFRRFVHNKLTFSLFYAFSENFLLPFSHDEVVHGKKSMINKMPGDDWKQFANLRTLYGYMYAHPGKKLLFMGCEFGQAKEWNHDTGLDWPLLEEERHRKLSDFVAALNHLYVAEPALYEQDFDGAGFQWIDFRDAESSVLIFRRIAKDPESQVVVAVNFTPLPRHGYRIGVPSPGPWREILNSDAEEYGGSGVLNPGLIATREGEFHELPQSIDLTLPPLGIVYLKAAPEKPKNPVKPGKKKKTAAGGGKRRTAIGKGRSNRKVDVKGVA